VYPGVPCDGRSELYGYEVDSGTMGRKSGEVWPSERERLWRRFGELGSGFWNEGLDDVEVERECVRPDSGPRLG
jgi:hypothetical protein